jgi:hypothetical protein
MKFWWGLAVLFFFSPSLVLSQNLCIQTHFGDTSFASGMVYDTEHQVIYVTGQVGSSSCFLGIMKQTTTGLQFLSKQVFEESAVCQSVALRTDQTATLLLISIMEEGGLLTSKRPQGSERAQQYGGMIELQVSVDGLTSTYRQSNSLLVHQDRVQIPRSIVADARLGNRAILAIMTSESSDENEYDSLGGILNLTPSGYLKYGNGFSMTVEMVQLGTTGADGVQQPVAKQWKKPFGVMDDETTFGVLVNQVSLHTQDELIVVGSTRGSGQAFGEEDSNNGGFVLGGFLTKLSTSTGALLMSKRIYFGDSNNDNSANATNTAIQGICHHDSDADFIYAVGSYIDISKNFVAVPFLTKVDADSLDPIWEVSFPASTNAGGVTCGISNAVDQDGNGFVYVAGVVEDGGQMMEQTTTHLQDDVFVAQVATADGSVIWIRQIGTAGNDRLAHGEGGLVVIDDGVLLMGDTTGNLYSTSSQASEIFVVHVDAQGNIPETTEVSGVACDNAVSGTMPITRPVKEGSSSNGDEGVIDTTNNEQVAATTPTPLATVPPIPGEFTEPPLATVSPVTSEASENEDAVSTGNKVAIFMSVILLIFLLFFLYMCFQQKKQEKVTERALVFSYLQAFDVEDIDVRHSATGGWHGTYVGKLAQGHVSGSSGIDNIDFPDADDGYDIGSGGGNLLSGFSHSSIVKDSLFVDYDSTPTYGGDDDDRHASHEDDETSSFVRDPKYFENDTGDRNDDDFNLARLSKAGKVENQHVVDPWGTEII